MDVRLGLATPHFVMGEGQARFRSQPHDGVAIVVVLQLALAMVFAVTRRRWAAAFDSDGTHNYGVFEGGAVEDGAVEDGAVEDASVDHPDKSHDGVPVRALTPNAGIGFCRLWPCSCRSPGYEPPGHFQG
jgi:hypothetical protein